jgi:Mn2+/Fe2+ NRAMP family transporter
MAMIAVFGTTISPYLFFWQPGQEIEIERETPGEQSLKTAPQQAPRELRRIRTDTLVGMALSQLIALFIVLTAAATLAQRGLNGIPSATPATEALRPVAGQSAFVLFSVGLVGTGLLAIPALAGSIAYARC